MQEENPHQHSPGGWSPNWQFRTENREN